jgi:hypothetical protein
MKRFLITVGTAYWGTTNYFRAEAESEKDLHYRASRAAEDNFYDLVDEEDEEDNEYDSFDYSIKEFPESLNWDDYQDLP